MACRRKKQKVMRDPPIAEDKTRTRWRVLAADFYHLWHVGETNKSARYTAGCCVSRLRGCLEEGPAVEKVDQVYMYVP